MSQPMPCPRESHVVVAVRLGAWKAALGDRSIRKPNRKSNGLLQDAIMTAEETGGVGEWTVYNLRHWQTSQAVDEICPQIGDEYNAHVLLVWSIDAVEYTVSGLLYNGILYTDLRYTCTKAHIWACCDRERRNVRRASLEQIQKEAVAMAWREARDANGKGPFPTLKVWQQWCAMPTRADCCAVRLKWRKANGYVDDDCRTNRTQYKRNMVQNKQRAA
jgi:hypothetical protein